MSCGIVLGAVFPDRVVGFRARTRHLLKCTSMYDIDRVFGYKPIRGQLMRRRSLCTVEDNDAIIHVNGERYV
jgi:hypothetical protein